MNKIWKPARSWFARTKTGMRVEKLLVDLPRAIQRELENQEFTAIIFTPSGTIERRGIVWNGRTCEVYVPARYGRELQGDATASIHFVDGQLKVEFEVV
ncbi:MAG: hypothetical protein H0Z19_10695 [Archaeoglobus sp.]|uniref:hypothetical protein n=1 Tax=Archaeoglobus sp. TaxID=1872626 RepID=UPI001DC11334|nr:hypothetical protein [Archaeoglobus sp.]MBO8180920.1 hypothetical protein [Archaeoglobus sp.]